MDKNSAARELETVVVALGGRTGSLILLDPPGDDLVIVAETGYGPDVTQVWGRFPLDAPLPASEAVRTGKAVFIGSPEERDRRYPAFIGQPVVQDAAYAIVPLQTGEGPPIGTLVVGFEAPRTFDDEVEKLLTVLANQLATAIDRTRLHEEAQAARALAEWSLDQLRFLAGATSLLASSLDYELTLEHVVQLAVPRVADFCAVSMRDDRDALHLLAVAHDDPARAPLVRAAFDRFPIALSGSGVPRVLRTGDVQVHRAIDDDAYRAIAQDDEHLAILRRIDLGSAMIVPLKAGGRITGVLIMGNTRGRLITDADVELAKELATRASVAIDHARLFTERSAIARNLQASLLPPSLPDIPGLELGARYVAAGSGIDVGGDFYDVFPVGENRWLLVAGDVKGKGVVAAAVTGLARHTLRSAAIRLESPCALLRHLNEVLLRHETERVSKASADDWSVHEPRFCTAIVAALEIGEGGVRATVCSAGHPLPIVRRADGTVIIDVGKPGDLIGVKPEVDLADDEIQLGHGDAIVCFTDGVTERHEARRFFDLAGVVAALSEADSTADEMAGAIEQAARAFVEGELRDDMAVLVVRFVPPSPTP